MSQDGERGARDQPEFRGQSDLRSELIAFVAASKLVCVQGTLPNQYSTVIAPYCFLENSALEQRPRKGQIPNFPLWGICLNANSGFQQRPCA